MLALIPPFQVKQKKVSQIIIIFIIIIIKITHPPSTSHHISLVQCLSVPIVRTPVSVVMHRAHRLFLSVVIVWNHAASADVSCVEICATRAQMRQNFAQNVWKTDNQIYAYSVEEESKEKKGGRRRSGGSLDHYSIFRIYDEIEIFTFMFLFIYLFI